MALITKDPHAWFTATNNKGREQTLYNDSTPQHNYPFAFECNFSDQPTPPVNTVTIYNMSKKHHEFYKKNQKCFLAFNWGKTQKILSEGYITKTDTHQTDGVTDTVVITYTEGTNYNNVKSDRLKVKKTKKTKAYKTVEKTKAGHWENTREVIGEHIEVYKKGKHKGEKHVVKEYKRGVKWIKPKTTKHRVRTRDKTKTSMVAKVFRAETSYKNVITGIASLAGIKIAKLQLAKNPSLKKSFSAKGKPMTLIKQYVKESGSKMTYQKGKLVIVDPKKEKRTWFSIDDQDLIQPPSCNESDDGSKPTWEITIPLVPEITFNTGIEMHSKYLKGRFYVKAGQHSSDGYNPQTQCSLEAL